MGTRDLGAIREEQQVSCHESQVKTNTRRNFSALERKGWENSESLGGRQEKRVPGVRTQHAQSHGAQGLSATVLILCVLATIRLLWTSAYLPV